MSEARIALAGVEALPQIEPLTRSLHEHHRTVDPDIPGVPLRDTDEWWAVRRERYRAWLGEPDTFLLIADDEGLGVGYALVTFHDRDDSNTTGGRFAELQSLVVSPDRRGGGLNIKFHPGSKIEPSRLMHLVSSQPGAQFTPAGVLRLPLPSSGDGAAAVLDFLDGSLKELVRT